MSSTRAALPWLAALVGVVSSVQGAEPNSLLAAVKEDRPIDIAMALQGGADPNALEADGTSVLHWAVHWGDLTWTTSLLHAGAAANRPNRYGIRPSYLAAENGDAAIMRALLEAGADPNAVFAQGETVLMTAARTGDVGTVRALIEAGADVNAAEMRDGQTALMWAAAANNAPAVTLLLDSGANRDTRDSTGDFTALAFAIRAGAVSAARALLDAGADANATLLDGTSLLMLATLNTNYAAAGALLDYGADPNRAAQGRTPLHEIARVRRWNRGFNLPGPEHRDNFSSLALARELVSHGADIDAPELTVADDGEGEPRRGPTPFLLATRALDLPYMHTLLDLGADPTLKTDDGTSAVMIAAGVGQGLGSAGASPGSVEEAIAALELTLRIGGGTVNDVNAQNETPLHGAMYRGGSIAVIDYLVEHGASLDYVVNSRGWTPLRIADGIALDGLAFIRYPEAAARLREHMRAQGLAVPPVVWDGPPGTSSQ